MILLFIADSATDLPFPVSDPKDIFSTTAQSGGASSYFLCKRLDMGLVFVRWIYTAARVAFSHVIFITPGFMTRFRGWIVRKSVHLGLSWHHTNWGVPYQFLRSPLVCCFKFGHSADALLYCIVGLLSAWHCEMPTQYKCTRITWSLRLFINSIWLKNDKVPELTWV